MFVVMAHVSDACIPLKHGIGADSIFFHVISMLQKNCVIKEHFIELCQNGHL